MPEDPIPRVRVVPPLLVEQEGAQIVVSLKPDRANWIQAVATMIASLIAFASIWLVTVQWRDQRRARGLEVMERFQAQFESMDMIAARAEAATNLENPSASPAVLTAFNFFERVGRHRRDGLITIDQVDYFFRDSLLCYWYAFEDWAKAVRKASGEDPETGATFREFQLLVADLRVRGQARPPQGHIRDILQQDIKRYEHIRASISAGPTPPAAQKKPASQDPPAAQRPQS